MGGDRAAVIPRKRAHAAAADRQRYNANRRGDRHVRAGGGPNVNRVSALKVDSGATNDVSLVSKDPEPEAQVIGPVPARHPTVAA